MIKPIPFSSLYIADHGWLKSRFHFSFAEYRNPENINFGPLRVMNDDLVQAQTGFGTHPHRDMEIITYVVSGELSHEDSMHNKESLGRGCIQYLSAGTGIAHSEMNDGNEEVRFIQTWIVPQANNLKPNYGSKCFDKSQRHNRWLHLVGPQNSEAAIFIYQDASIYACEIDATKTLDFELKSNRQAYIKILEGSAMINGIAFEHGDAAEVIDESIDITASTDLHILLVEMKKEG